MLTIIEFGGGQTDVYCNIFSDFLYPIFLIISFAGKNLERGGSDCLQIGWRRQGTWPMRRPSGAGSKLGPDHTGLNANTFSIKQKYRPGPRTGWRIWQLFQDSRQGSWRRHKTAWIHLQSQEDQARDGGMCMFWWFSVSSWSWSARLKPSLHCSPVMRPWDSY